MKKILRITCSPRAHESESYRLSERILHHLRARYPDAELADRELWGSNISHVDTHYAGVLGGFQSGADLDGTGTLAESESLIRELEDSDCLVIATPMHNYTVPSTLKAWIDHVVRVHRTFQLTRHGKAGTLQDRPTFIAISSGDTYSHEPLRQPDFLTPYLTAVLNTIGISDIAFFSVQGSGCGPDAIQQARIAAEARLAEHFMAVGA